MATSSTLVPQHVLNDEEKELLLARCLDLVFVDDVTELSCKRCRRVLIHNYVANCGHLFCKNCKRVLSEGTGWKCPECKEYITQIGEQKAEVEERVYGLMVHCLNHKYGCKLIMPLRQITTHLKSCEDTKEANLPRLLYADTYSLEAVVDRMHAMSERINGLMEHISQSQKQTQDHLLQKVKEMDDKQRLDNDIKLKELENRISTDLQSEMNKLHSQIAHSHTDIIKELNAKLSKMEETANRHADEIEQVSEKIVQSQTATDNKFKNLDEKQSRDAERMEQKMERWNYNLITQTARSQTQTEDRCNQRLRETEEKVTLVKHQLDEMESKQCDAECKVTLQDFQIKLDQFCAEMRQSMDEMKKTMTQMSEEKCKSAVDKPNVNLIQDIQTKLEDNSTTPDYNILLLGESGSGKSLFINSFASYIHHDQLGDALSAPPTQCIIPTTVVTTKNHQEKQIHFGMANKSQAPGRFETTVCTTYEFQLDNLLVRLIDSPGIGGPGQVTDNKTLLESILDFVSRCEFNVNSLAIVAKSNQSEFDRQLHEVFNRLRCHVDNVLFLLTHSGDTDYRPGDVMQPFNELFKDSPNIKPSKENMYCFDNKGFRYMLMNQSGHGSDIEFEESYEDAWETSTEEFYRLIQHLANGSHSTRGIIAPPIEHLSAAIEARRYSECCSHFINATVDIISEIYREQISLRDKFTLFKLLKLEIKPEFRNVYTSVIYKCTSKSCPKLQQVPTWADVNKRVVICSKWFRFSWLGEICNECGCRVNTHVKINISEEIKQCKEKIIELQRTKDEWKTVKNMAAQLNMMSKAKMVRSTDSKTDVGQSGGDHKEETVTLANVFQLKKKLLDLPIYGPQLKEHFSKYT